MLVFPICLNVKYIQIIKTDNYSKSPGLTTITTTSNFTSTSTTTTTTTTVFIYVRVGLVDLDKILGNSEKILRITTVHQLYLQIFDLE